MTAPVRIPIGVPTGDPLAEHPRQPPANPFADLASREQQLASNPFADLAKREGALDAHAHDEESATTPPSSVEQEIGTRAFTPAPVRFAEAQRETTRLSPEDEDRFQSWAAQHNLTDVDQPASHYDYRGAFTAGISPSANGHWPDTYKQHGHPTFSVESQYSSGPDDGGHWDGETFIPARPPRSSADIRASLGDEPAPEPFTLGGSPLAPPTKSILAPKGPGPTHPNDIVKDLVHPLPDGTDVSTARTQTMPEQQMASFRIPRVRPDATEPAAPTGTNADVLTRDVSAGLAPTNEASLAEATRPTTTAGKVAYAAGSMAAHPLSTVASVVEALPKAAWTLGQFTAQEQRKGAGLWKSNDGEDAADVVSPRDAAFAAGQLLASGASEAALPFVDSYLGASMAAKVEKALAAEPEATAARRAQVASSAMLSDFSKRVATQAAAGGAIGASFSSDDPKTGAILGALVGGLHAYAQGAHGRIPIDGANLQDHPDQLLSAGRHDIEMPVPREATATPLSSPPHPTEPDFTVESPAGNTQAPIPLAPPEYLRDWDERTMGPKPTREEWALRQRRTVDSFLDVKQRDDALAALAKQKAGQSTPAADVPAQSPEMAAIANATRLVGPREFLTRVRQHVSSLGDNLSPAAHDAAIAQVASAILAGQPQVPGQRADQNPPPVPPVQMATPAEIPPPAPVMPPAVNAAPPIPVPSPVPPASLRTPAGTLRANLSRVPDAELVNEYGRMLDANTADEDKARPTYVRDESNHFNSEGNAWVGLTGGAVYAKGRIASRNRTVDKIEAELARRGWDQDRIMGALYDYQANQPKTPYDTPEVIAARRHSMDTPETITDESPEREQVRSDLAEQHYANAIESIPEVRRTKEVGLVIGNSGSGKTTLAVEPLSQHLSGPVFDTDAAKRLIPEYDNGKGSAVVFTEAGKINEMARDLATTEGQNFVFPTVGSKPGKLKAMLDQLHEDGYRVHVRYVHVPMEVAAQRAADRYTGSVRNPGAPPSHFVDPQHILSVGRAPLESYRLAKAHPATVSYAHVDNSEEGQPPRLVEAHNAPDVERYAHGSASPVDLRSVLGPPGVSGAAGSGGSGRHDEEYPGPTGRETEAQEPVAQFARSGPSGPDLFGEASELEPAQASLFAGESRQPLASAERQAASDIARLRNELALIDRQLPRATSASDKATLHTRRRAIATQLVPLEKLVNRGQAISAKEMSTRVAAEGQVQTAQALGVRRKPEPPTFDRPEGPFYSRLDRAIQSAPFEKGTADQWKAHLSKNVAAGEREWTGVDQLLNENAGQVLTKAQIAKQFADNKIELKESVAGDGAFRVVESAGHPPHVVIGPDGTEVRRFISRADAQAQADHLSLAAGRSGPPKFKQYTEPGGSNYREIKIQLKLPSQSVRAKPESLTALPDDYHLTRANAPRDPERWSVVPAEQAHGRPYAGTWPTQQEAIDAALDRLNHERYAQWSDERAQPDPRSFKSSHFDEPDILAHARVTDRTLPNGEKVLFVEELQSDWHQKGRSQGYRKSASADERAAAQEKVGAINDRLRAIVDEREALRNGFSEENWSSSKARTRWNELSTEYDQLLEDRQGLVGIIQGKPSEVPDAPFKKTEEWMGLAMKRLIDEAVKTGADRISWTTGDQQAARYDLSKQVDAITYDPKTNELIADKNGDVVHTGKYDAKALPEVIGKEAAERLLASPARPKDEVLADLSKHGVQTAPHPIFAGEKLHLIRGDDLKVGGAGMRAFYDQMLPKWVKEYAKKMGVKVDIEPVKLGILRPGHEWEVFRPTTGEVMHGGFRSEAEARDYAHRLGLSKGEHFDYSTETSAEQQSFRVAPFAEKVKAEGQYHFAHAASGGSSRVPPTTPPAPPSGPASAHPMPEPAGLEHERAAVRPFEFARKIKAVLNPESLGPDAKATAGTIRHEAAERFRAYRQATHLLGDLEKHVEKQPRARQVALWDAYERGQLTGDRYVDQANRIFRTVTEQRTAELIALDRLKAEKAIDNYIGRFWAGSTKVPATKQVTSFISSLFSKRPFEGTKSFLKQRWNEHFTDGLDHGLVPATYNYVSSQLAKIQEMERLIGAEHMLRAEASNGRAKKVLLGKDAPVDAEGDQWIRIDRDGNDPAFTVWGPPTIPVKEAFDAGIRDGLTQAIARLKVQHTRATTIPRAARSQGANASTLGYAKGDREIFSRFGSHDGVLMHELGHILDNRYGLQQMFAADPKTEPELKALAELRHEGQDLADPKSKRFAKYVQQPDEQVANALHALIHAPETMASVAPITRGLLTNFLASKPELRQILDIAPSLRLDSAEGEVKTLGPTVVGYWYAPKNSAAVWQNHLSRGLRGNPVYDMVTAPGSAATSLILGVSGFHATVIATEGMFSDLVMAADKAASGQPIEAATSLGHIVGTPLTTALSALSPSRSKAAQVAFGAKVMAEYLTKGSHPELTNVVEAMVAGGFRGKAESELWNGDRTKKLQRAIRDALHGDTRLQQAWGASKVPLDAIYAGIELAARPLMGRYVPLMKTAATYRAVAQRLGELPRDITPDQLHQEMWDVVKEMDLRFGQVEYDNHFINNTAKHAAQAMFLAPGWTFGTLDLMGRGVRDLAVAPKRVYDRATGKPGASEQPVLGRSAKYWLAALIGTMVLNGLLTYANTGQTPGASTDGRDDGWKDFFAFRDGTRDAAGNPNRHTIPGYLMHDVYGWTHHPYSTFMNKLSPFWAFAGRVARNETYFGDMIRNPDDPGLTQAKQVGKEAVKEFAPLSVQNYLEGQKRGETGASEIARTGFGVTPAKREFVRTPAQNKLADYLASQGHPVLTPEQQDKSTLRQQILQGRRERTVPRDSVIRLERAGELTPRQAKTILAPSTATAQNPLVTQFKALTLEQARTVFALGEPWEQSLWERSLRIKEINARREKAGMGPIHARP